MRVRRRATVPGRRRNLRGRWLRYPLCLALIMAAVVVSAGPASADQFRNGHWVRGAIEQEFIRLGTLWPGGPPTVGEPNSDELDAARGGRWQAFGVDTNRIYWHPNVAGGKANQVGGLILQKWLTNGDERGALGYPLVSETPVNGGRFNHFEGGSIYWKNGATAAYIVRGAIRDYWAQADWEKGAYGFPVSDEYDFGGGRRQDFERGSLYWNVHVIDAEAGRQELAASTTPQRINPSDNTTDPTALDDLGPQPRSAPAPLGLSPRCSGNVSNPDRWIACSRKGWVLKERRSENGTLRETGRLPYTVALSVEFDKVTQFNSGNAAWKLDAKIDVGTGVGNLAGGTRAHLATPCLTNTSKCGTGTVLPTKEVPLTPNTTVEHTWNQYANNLGTAGAIEKFTGLIGITLKNAGGLTWSHTDASLDARCDHATIRTGCVNPTAMTAVVYDPVKNPAIAAVSQHVFDAQASLPSHWGNPQYNYLTRTTNQAIIDANRDKACPAGSPVSCDEFALASTYQGASRVAANDYSTRTVPKVSNDSQGGIMSNYYNSTRILDGDQFGVVAVLLDGRQSW
ncbi:LGFP repeat-containing protein [Amycolatopsis sp. NPDC052450]|uniref:LGFP repeat-containing protein n=1 Tax=Amycolatopsis sp. NPDC052450 TaxID=3363937 RepID=UPI0037C7C490